MAKKARYMRGITMTYLEFLMERANLSQANLARWLNINQGKLSAILAGKCRPNKTEKHKLEQAFKNLPIHILLEDMDETRETEVA
jgi:predicted XRE-type DNA-binding protein